jgi:8-oxo-dGTP pyrophosphatase MutT (NUDIX family)
MKLREAVDADELNLLNRRWGAAPLTHHRLNVAHPFLTGNHQMLVSDGRRAEICYVMHRGDPHDGVLLHIKTIYPEGAFRLPTGGIHEGESIFETLVREIYEETGLTVGENAEDVKIERFLGAISYRLSHETLGARDFATYPFLARMPKSAALSPQDPEEKIGGWRWDTPDELVDVADYLAAIGDIDPVWADWGRFRAILHRFVATSL